MPGAFTHRTGDRRTVGKPSSTSEDEAVPESSWRSRSSRRSACLVAIAISGSLLTGCGSEQSSIDREAESLFPVVGSTPSEIPPEPPLTWDTNPVQGWLGERRELGAENSPDPFFEGRDVSSSAPSPISVGEDKQPE